MKITNFKTLILMLLATSVLTLTGCDKSGTPSEAEGIVGTDRTAPVLTLVGGDMTLNEGDTYIEEGATAVDDIDGTVPVVITGTVDTDTVRVYTLTYTATDSSANESNVTRTVTVLDITPPVITLSGSANITMNEDIPYAEPGAAAVDNVDGTVPVVITGTVDTSTPGVYTFTYTATDSSSNTSSVTRTVTVLDITPPVITLSGSANITMNEDIPYAEPGAAAVDNVDGTVPVVITGTVDTSTPGVYTFTYTATDSSSNTSSVTRTVTVLDITPPVITLSGSANITMNEDIPYAEPGAAAVDNVDGTVPVVITGTVDTSTPGVYTFTYTATDSSSNTSSVTRTVTVLDITPPVIRLNGDANVIIDQGDTYTEENATAVDNVDGTVPVVITGTVDTDTVGIYTLTYTATDSSTNESNVTRTINIIYSGPAPLDGNITIDNAALQSIIASVFDSTPYDPAIDVQGVINAQGLTVSVPYTVNTAAVTLAAYSTSVTLDASVTKEDAEASIVATFAWAEQNLTVGSGVFTATITIDDRATDYPDNIYNAKQLDIEDNIAGLVAAIFPYATDSVGGEGNLTLKIMPGIPDRMFGVADKTGDATTHNFLYLPVTSATTGKTWLNNNLGANYANTNSPVFNLAKQATASNDHNAYGSLFQWGRKANGHELMTWTSGSAGTSTNGVRYSVVSPSSPDDGIFIATQYLGNWRFPHDDTLWASESSANNVCPVGYRVPTGGTGGELDLEFKSWTPANAAGAITSTLAISLPGLHRYTDNGFSNIGGYGYYWGSTTTLISSYSYGDWQGLSSAGTSSSLIYRTYGMPVRCIKD